MISDMIIVSGLHHKPQCGRKEPRDSRGKKLPWGENDMSSVPTCIRWGDPSLNLMDIDVKIMVENTDKEIFFVHTCI